MQDRFDEMAKELRKIMDLYGHGPQTTERWYAAVESLERKAVSLLRAAATVPPNMVRVGVEDMSLLGTLPVTDDGCVIGEGATVWRVYENWRDGLGISSIKAHIDWYDPDRPEKYADPEKASKKLKEVQEQNDRIKRQAAAEAARQQIEAKDTPHA